jgi:hypothetical protein
MNIYKRQVLRFKSKSKDSRGRFKEARYGADREQLIS